MRCHRPIRLPDLERTLAGGVPGGQAEQEAQRRNHGPTATAATAARYWSRLARRADAERDCCDGGDLQDAIRRQEDRPAPGRGRHARLSGAAKGPQPRSVPATSSRWIRRAGPAPGRPGSIVPAQVPHRLDVERCCSAAASPPDTPDRTLTGALRISRLLFSQAEFSHSLVQYGVDVRADRRRKRHRCRLPIGVPASRTTSPLNCSSPRAESASRATSGPQGRLFALVRTPNDWELRCPGDPPLHLERGGVGRALGTVVSRRGRPVQRPPPVDADPLSTRGLGGRVQRRAGRGAASTSPAGGREAGPTPTALHAGSCRR